MIYYQLSGSELVENCESYLPWVDGIQEHFIVKFSKEQSIEKLELIFVPADLSVSPLPSFAVVPVLIFCLAIFHL